MNTPENLEYFSVNFTKEGLEYLRSLLNSKADSYKAKIHSIQTDINNLTFRLKMNEDLHKDALEELEIIEEVYRNKK